MADIVRKDGRTPQDLRNITFQRNWNTQAEGSTLVCYGNTRILCTASVTPGVPRWMLGSGKGGWVSAEYSMLPRATNTRNMRESVKGKISGRTHEISRLLGRSLRAAVDLKALGENTILIDCDVLQADGGTRTAAISGAYIALYDAIQWAKDNRLISRNKNVIKDSIAAVSVGIVDGIPLLDLPYEEDSRAETDMNIIMKSSLEIIEIQGTAEVNSFTRKQLNILLDLAEKGIGEISLLQAKVLEES